MSAAVQNNLPPSGRLDPSDYEAALTGTFALMASQPEPGTPESQVVERIFGLDPIAAADTARWMEAMKEAARRWANEQ